MLNFNYRIDSLFLNFRDFLAKKITNPISVHARHIHHVDELLKVLDGREVRVQLVLQAVSPPESLIFTHL